MTVKNEPLVLLDSDVFRHFLNGNRLQTLAEVLQGRLVILDKVKNELCRSKSLIEPVNKFLATYKISVTEFPPDSDIVREYAMLRNKFGEGESACMAVARFRKQYIASSNLKDIRVYCETNTIVYLTTMDLLTMAFESKFLSEEECNKFIRDVKSKGSKLPCDTLTQYFKMIK